MGIVSQAGHNLGKLGRKDISGIHRHKLPDLHRSAAHLCKLIRNASDVLRGQKQIAQGRALSSGQLR